MLNKLLTMSMIVAGVSACATVGHKKQLGESNLNAVDVGASGNDAITKTGPSKVPGRTYTFTQDNGKAFKVLLDQRVIRGCYPDAAYNVTKMNDGEYAVEMVQAAVALAECAPENRRDIQMGTVIEVPAVNSIAYAIVHFYGKHPKLAQAKVKTKAAQGVRVGAQSSIGKFSEYTFTRLGGRGFTVDIDRQTISDCFPRVGHTDYKVGGSTNDHLVNIEHLMTPAVMCSPSMRRNIELGLSLDVASKNGMAWTRIMLMGSANGDNKVEARDLAGDSPVVTPPANEDMNSDADIKLQSLEAWKDAMPVIDNGGVAGDRTFAVAKVEVDSWGCTNAADFKAWFVQKSTYQHLVISRTEPDVCEATQHRVELEIRIEGGYKMGKKVKFKNKVVSVSEQVVH